MANGAHAVIFDKKRTKVLMVKRRDVPVWVFPGGRIESGEDPKDAAVRETEEESGYKVKVKRLVGIYTKPNKEAGYVFECVLTGGEAKTSSESSAVEFFPINSLPELIPPTVTVWLKETLKNSQDPIVGVFPQIELKIILQNLLRHPNVIFRYFLTACFGIHLD